MKTHVTIRPPREQRIMSIRHVEIGSYFWSGTTLMRKIVVRGGADERVSVRYLNVASGEAVDMVVFSMVTIVGRVVIDIDP